MGTRARGPVGVASAPGLRRLRFDVAARPLIVLFELTRACELACRHCRAEAVRRADPDQLTTTEVLGTLDDLGSLGAPRPIVVLTGGDPLLRDDLEQLVRHGTTLGLAMAVSPAGTPRANRSHLAGLRRAGASTVSFSLDGASPATHDAFRGVEGSFDWTLAGCRAASAVGLRLQINTTVSAETVTELPDIARLVARLQAKLWSVFFLVPTGRAKPASALGPEETEDVLHFLADVAASVPLKTTEAPAYRRVLLERGAVLRSTASRGPLYTELLRRWERLAPTQVRAPGDRAAPTRSPLRAPLTIGDGRGVVFVSHRGEVCPSGFLPLVAGNLRDAPLSTIYASSPLFEVLRDPERLAGRCGRCEYRMVCGGSRAQAYARFGDPLGEDPTCAHRPGATLSVLDGSSGLAGEPCAPTDDSHR